MRKPKYYKYLSITINFKNQVVLTNEEQKDFASNLLDYLGNNYPDLSKDDSPEIIALDALYPMRSGRKVIVPIKLKDNNKNKLR